MQLAGQGDYYASAALGAHTEAAKKVYGFKIEAVAEHGLQGDGIYALPEQMRIYGQARKAGVDVNAVKGAAFKGSAVYKHAEAFAGFQHKADLSDYCGKIVNFKIEIHLKRGAGAGGIKAVLMLEPRLKHFAVAPRDTEL